MRKHLPLAALAALALASAGCERKATPPPPGAAAAAPPVASTLAGERLQLQFAKVDFPEVPIRAGATTSVGVMWKAPEGTGVNEDAPFKVRWTHSDALAEAPSDVKSTGTSARDGFHIAVRPLNGAPNATLTGMIDLVVCDNATHAVCIPVRRKVDIEFVVGPGAPAETTVTVDLPRAKAL